MSKFQRTYNLLLESKKPALMCSFGKDSMVLLHLVRETLGSIPVIHHRHPYFPFKNEFADSVIRSWNLEVHDYPPMSLGVKVNPERLELVSRYSFGQSGLMDVPLNTEPPVPRRQFACGLDWVTRPKTLVSDFPWRTVLIGHKSSDVDPFEGPVPLLCDTTKIGNMDVAFPLRHWTDDDVWDYIEKYNVPYDKRRYQDRKELVDTWANPDYIHACTACIDPRESSDEVWCPKFNLLVKNRGKEVLQLNTQLPYVQREAA